MDDRIHVSSIVIHRGEEPPVSGNKGIVNVFFPSCNMQCIYCQNWEISCRGTQGTVMSLNQVCDAIIELLPQSENNLGFVSPSHFVPQIISIVEEIRQRGYSPTIIYNTNCYDLPETLKTLEGIVDVWLPDFKYSDNRLAEELSQAPGYREYALSSLKEMLRQTGATLHTDDCGIARRGIIIRHLVLPGQSENSIGVLKAISEELSASLHISLMSQYYPPLTLTVSPPKLGSARQHNESRGGPSNPLPENEKRKPIRSEHSALDHLKRPITKEEYESVLEAFHTLGFSNGWLQEYDSQLSYRPNFEAGNPFDGS